MNQRNNPLKVEKIRNYVILYSAAFLLALIFRLLHLAKPMLSDGESVLALQVMDNPNFSIVDSVANPAYVAITRLIFFLVSPTNFSARFVSALFGSILVLTPAFFHKWLGNKNAVLLAFLLAFEPSLFALSRQVDSTTLCLTVVLFAVGAFLNGKYLFCGVCLAFAILGGPVFWPFAFSIFLAALWGGVFIKKNSSKFLPSKASFSPRLFLFGFVPTLILVGTFGFLKPELLSGITASLVEFFTKHAFPQNSLTILALILIGGGIYLPVYWMIGWFGIIKGILKRDALDLFLSRWLLTAFAIVILNPGRKVTDLAWVVIPLIALVSRNLNSLLKLPGENRSLFISKVGFDLAILAFIWLNLVWWIGNYSLGYYQLDIRMLVMIGAVVMIILVSILVGWGWSWQVSWKSLIIALMILLSLYQLSATRRAGFLEKKQSNEFFSNSPLVTNGGELTKNLKQYSQKLEGKQVLKDVSVFTPYPPSLKWALRDLSNVKFVNALDPNALPAFVISFSDEKNLSAGDYRGESLVWQQTIEWENMKWYEWGNWLAFRKVPVSLQRVILWMRVDLFPADYLWSN